MEPPDSDPLLAFLVAPAPKSPRSATISPPHGSSPPDLQPTSPELPVDGSSASAHHGTEEIEVPEAPTQRPPASSSSQAAESSGHQASADQSMPVPASQPSSEDRQGQSSKQGPQLPASPTSIDQDLQEKIWAILPELAKDLKNLKEQRPASELEVNRTLINPLPLDPPAISTSQRATTSSHSMVLQPEEGTFDETAILSARIPASLKGKETQSGGIHGAAQVKSTTPVTAMVHSETSPPRPDPDASILHPSEHQLLFSISEEGWESAKATRKYRGAKTESRAMKPSDLPIPKSSGSHFFRSKLEGRCFNCFSPNHLAKDCHASHRCWKCYLSGHRAAECHSNRGYKVEASALRTATACVPNPATASPTSLHSARPLSYAEAVRGPAPMAARYPGDPRARPERAYCAVSATGAIKRRRDDLIHRAAVCWLYSNSHETEPHHLGEAIRGSLHLRHNDFQIVKHYPEQFLVIFNNPADRARLLDRGAISEGARVFNFAPWSERRNATNVIWEFRVKARIEGIPPHCWAEDVAAKALGRSCAVHFLEEKTRRRERTRTFDLWAWCSNPNDIPKEVILTVTEPDREPPSTSMQYLQAPQYRDEPVDLKRGDDYTLRNHLEWVEDLTFLQGRGRSGGALNRLPRRELIWTYGVSDSVGERPAGRRYKDRGRDMGGYHKRDDDDYDYDHDRGHRSHGTRRHRSISSWARNSRCRGAMDDCISSNRWRGGRGSPPARSRATATTQQVWRVKQTKNKIQKRVTFAEPLATVLKPPKPRLRDDSILLIKEHVNKAQEQGHGDGQEGNNKTADIINNLKAVSEESDMEGHNVDESGLEGHKEGQIDMPDIIRKLMMDEEVQQAMTETIKRMNMELAAACNNMHFQRPVEMPKMSAIQVLIEEGIKKKKSAVKKTAAQVVLEA